ncbi:hypothetical protein [Conexivisphaera calida]|uniref:hypothetical protein n=1 Tax=Conexivisphaera calida TaxID=1874277 RepID=UPI00157AF2AC|nr:hypothetical protein [Conexivisphaera calida]
MESEDDVLRRMLRRMIEMASRSQAAARDTGASASPSREYLGALGPGTPPGSYQYVADRRAWLRVGDPGSWRPSSNGLYVVLREDAGSCRSCRDFADLASGASGGLIFVAEISAPEPDRRPQPRLSISCFHDGEVLEERSYRGAMGLPELSSLVLRFIRICPSVDAAAATASIRAVCPCSEYRYPPAPPPPSVGGGGGAGRLCPRTTDISGPQGTLPLNGFRSPADDIQGSWNIRQL